MWLRERRHRLGKSDLPGNAARGPLRTGFLVHIATGPYIEGTPRYRKDQLALQAHRVYKDQQHQLQHPNRRAYLSRVLVAWTGLDSTEALLPYLVPIYTTHI
jgi:hypothetical protein